MNIDAIYNSEGEIIIAYKWQPQNLELRDFCFHRQEYPIATHEQDALDHDEQAKIDLFNIINQEYPEVYTL